MVSAVIAPAPPFAFAGEVVREATVEPEKKDERKHKSDMEKLGFAAIFFIGGIVSLSLCCLTVLVDGNNTQRLLCLLVN